MSKVAAQAAEACHAALPAFSMTSHEADLGKGASGA